MLRPKNNAKEIFSKTLFSEIIVNGADCLALMDHPVFTTVAAHYCCVPAAENVRLVRGAPIRRI